MGRTADFSGVGDYTAIKAADYELEFESYEWKKPKEPAGGYKASQLKGPEYGNDPETGEGTPFHYANAKWIVSDEVDDEGNIVQGKVVFDMFSENPKALFRLKQASIASGEDPEMFEAEVDDNGQKLPLKLDLDTVLGRMVGRTLIGSVTVEEYTNPQTKVTRKSNKIAKYASVEQPTALSASRR